MSESKLQPWEKDRSREEIRYILVHGLLDALGRVLLIHFFLFAYNYFFDPDDFQRLMSRFPSSFIIFFVVFAVFGVIEAQKSWNRKESSKGSSTENE